MPRLALPALALAAAVLLAACRRAEPPLDALWELPPFTATAADAQTARAFSSAELRGQPFVADFIFTRCGGPCPVLSQALARLQSRLPRSVRLLSFTVDPEYDTPEVLRAYAGRYSAEPGRWLFLRLERPELLKLAQEGFRLTVALRPGAPPSEGVIHSSKLVLVDGKGFVRALYDGTEDASLDAVARDAARLTAEPATR